MLKYFLLLSSITACIEKIHPQSYGIGKSARSSILWKDKSIAVTWDEPNPKDSTERRWVQEAIADSWEKETALEFTHWTDFSKLSGNINQVIRIRVEDDPKGPRVKYFGSKLNRVHAGITLNFHFKNWGTGIWPEQVPDRKTAIKAIAVHEFGHALGFYHQQDRIECHLCDSSYQKRYLFSMEETPNKKASIWPTRCDPYSVMNYCNNQYLNHGVLSENDVAAARKHYGPPSNLDTSHSIILNYTAEFKGKASKTSHIKQAQAQHVRNGDYVVINEYKYYLVTLFISASAIELSRIYKVVYFLDPLSFKANKGILGDNNNLFRYSFYAWGNFPVKATIKYKDGTEISKEILLDKIPPFIIQTKILTLQGVVNKIKKLPTKSG